MTKSNERENKTNDHNERQEHTCHQQPSVIACAIHARGVFVVREVRVEMRSDRRRVVVLQGHCRFSDGARHGSGVAGGGRAMSAHGIAYSLRTELTIDEQRSGSLRGKR